ncbi:MAG: hypothetical protein CVU11_09225 [Bacteroidetes bacterium HGW-Bacteroidetes-6]|jgi:hypothetical protein|nr:MAG: hypothetical protein CVU11_09225 [Bacteroidetes bacterium HGW-Bacteroidetes-6]
MKAKYIIVLLIAILRFANGQVSAQNFVTIENNQFVDNGVPFFPIVVNYGVDVVKSGSNYWLSPDHRYGNTNGFECNDASGCADAIRNDLTLLFNLGVRAVRLVGLGVDEHNSNGILLRCVQDLQQNIYYESISSPFTNQFTLVNSFLDIAEDVGVKVIWCPGIRNGVEIAPWTYEWYPITADYGSYLTNAASYFENNETLMAYDLVNEPANISLFDPSLSKTAIANAINQWISNMKAEDANHLITIGLLGYDDVLHYDPDLLCIDFVSIHPYPIGLSYLPEYDYSNVFNDIYFYSQYCSKPWMIGETGIANKLYTPSFDEQTDYVQVSMERTVNCNGLGYSWWWYSDNWTNSQITDDEADLGVVNNSGVIQPFAGLFAPFISSYEPDYNCNCLSSFYNEKSEHSYRATGVLKNSISNLSIDGGLIIIRDTDWGIHKTFSSQGGRFDLYSNEVLGFDMWGDCCDATATGFGYSNTVFNFTGSTQPISISGTTFVTGTSASYSTASSISIANSTIQGNGVTGAVVNLYGAGYVNLNNGTLAQKGAIFTVEPAYNLGNIYLTPLTVNCSQSSSRTQIDSGKNSSDEENLELMPNPTSGVFGFNTEFKMFDNVAVYNQMGQLVYSIDGIGSDRQIDISSNPSGIYMVVVVFEGKSITRRLLLQNTR